MKKSDINIWLGAFEQEIIEVASRVEAIRKKLLQFTSRDVNEFGRLKSLSNSLQGEVVNLRQLGQRARFKNAQILRAEESLEKSS
jgi:hypothetical protein